jgi:hypothetical protein
MTEAAEVDRLRARVVELESQLADHGGVGGPRRRRRAGRATASAVLIAIGCILMPFSVLAVWTSNQISDTDRYVDTIAPLADDPGVQAAIATNVTAAIVERLDVQAVATEALNTIADQPNVPPRVAAVLPGLSVPLSNGVESFVRDQVGEFVASPQFATIWQQANRVAHEQLVKLLEGNQGGAVTAGNGEVTLELGPIVAQVKQRLLDRGFDLANNIPTVQKSFVLVRSDAVTKAQGVYRLLNTLGNWLPFIALAFFAVGVYLARDHRHALLAGALGGVGALLALGVLIAVARLLYLDAVPADVLPRDAAASVFDTLVRFLRTGLRAVAVLGLVVALAAFAVGPSTTALRGRRALARGISTLGTGAGRAGWSSGSFGVWLAAHKRAVDLGLVALGALVLTFWARPTAAVVVMIAVAVLILVLVVEFLAFRPTPAVPEQRAESLAPEGDPATTAPFVPVQTRREPPPPEGATATTRETEATRHARG